jgi:tetratricopeptide (TPR) repeat protein
VWLSRTPSDRNADARNRFIVNFSSRLLRGIPIIFLLAFVGCPKAFSQNVRWQDYVDEARSAYLAKDFARSEGLYLLALKEAGRFGVNDLKVAQTLNALSIVYNAQRKYENSLELYVKALAIREKTFGAEHPEIIQSLRHIADLFSGWGRQSDAEPWYRRELELREKIYGPEQREVADGLFYLGRCLGLQKKYLEGETNIKRGLEILERHVGSDSPGLVMGLTWLAGNYFSQGRFDEAETVYLRCLKLREGSTDLRAIVFSANNLCLAYRRQGRLAEAENLYKICLEALESEYGPEDSNLLATLQYYAGLLQESRRFAEADAMKARMQRIREKNSTPNPQKP